MSEGSSEPSDQDELVPLARIYEEMKKRGWPAYKVRLVLGELSDEVRVSFGTSLGKVDRRVKRYPLAYTISLLEAKSEPQKEVTPELESDEMVSLDRIVEELGLARNTVRRYMTSARPRLYEVSNPRDGRRKLYPLQQTLKVVRREHGRVQARNLRAKDPGGGYWIGLAQLKVTAANLLRLSQKIAAAARETRESYDLLRRMPVSAEIRTLPDGLALVQPLTVLVSPLRLTYWKAVVPNIPLRGEGNSYEEAVRDLQTKLAKTFRQLQDEPWLNPDLWTVLSEMIRIRRARKTAAE
jgi:hypothetical protein